MSEARSRRRWFQFGLRALFWPTTAVALALFAIREQRERMKSHSEAQAREAQLRVQIEAAHTEIELLDQIIEALRDANRAGE